jgi:uncharacterized coiled-coil protein SlyX
VGSFVYKSTERINELENTQTANTKTLEEFNGNLKIQLEKMVEEFHKASKQYREALNQISTL